MGSMVMRDQNGEPMTAEQCIEMAEGIEREMQHRPEHWHRAMKRTAREWRKIAAQMLVDRRP